MPKRSKDKFYMGNPNVPSRGAVFEYTPEMAVEIEKCSKDILHFAENYFHILNVDEGRQKIKLYDAQKRVLKKIDENRFFCLVSSRQIGKALALDTPIVTPNGWTTMGNLKEGDVIYGGDGTPCNVIHAFDVRYDRPCYEVIFDNGERIIADGEHNWFTQTKTERKKNKSGSVKTTEEIYNTQILYGEPNHRIPSCVKGLYNTEKDLTIPPYILGIWLGDGATDGSRISVGERDILELLENFEQYNTKYKISYKKHHNAYLVNLGMLSGRNGSHKEISLMEELKKMGLLGNKHIPIEYFYGSREQRLELLRGLMDSDGYIDKDGYAFFYNTNLKMALQVKELIESLGYKTLYKTFIPTLNGIECSECAEVSFKPRELVCKLSFKTKRIKINNVEYPESKRRNQWHYIKQINPVESVPVRCIEVDSPDHLFLAGKTLIPTHNTTIATIYLLWLSNFFKDQKILLVANKEDTAKEIFGRVRMAYEMLPVWLKSPVVTYGKTEMEFENGSSIKITTTTGTAGRGSSCSMLFIDEISWIESHLLEPFWASVFPIVSSSKKAKVFMCSTPNGTGNLFHRIYTQALENGDGWACDKILWSDIPGRDEKWAREIKAGLSSEEAWRAEYECEFINSGTSSMNEQLYNRLKGGLREPIEILSDGKYKIWDLPDPDHVYVAGVDVSDGLGADYSVIKVLDITDLNEIIEVAEYYDNTIPVAEFSNKLYEILQNWGNPLVCIERNNQGGQVVDRLALDYGYQKVVSWGAKLAARKNTQLFGMISSRNTKYYACANARYFYSEKAAVVFRNEESLEELFKDFVKLNDTWQAASGKHDDRTMALIWALMILDKDLCEKWFTVDEFDQCGKPLVISPLDFGIRYFENPTSIYTNEHVDRIENSRLAPMVFGALGETESEIEQLKRDGWVLLGTGDLRNDPSRNLSLDQWSTINRWFGG